MGALEGGVTAAMSGGTLANIAPDPNTLLPPQHVWHGCVDVNSGRRPLLFTPYRFLYPALGLDTVVMMTRPCPFCGQVVWYELRSNQ